MTKNVAVTPLRVERRLKRLAVLWFSSQCLLATGSYERRRFAVYGTRIGFDSQRLHIQIMASYKLITEPGSNPKLAKGSELGWVAAGLTLAQGKLSGRNVCPWMGACERPCLGNQGRGRMTKIMRQRVAKTRRLFDDRAKFKEELHSDVGQFSRWAFKKGLKPSFRLNVLSDLSWERIFPELFEDYPEVQFYDYTKSYVRAVCSNEYDGWPLNYKLAYSFNEKVSEHLIATAIRKVGLVVVFRREMQPRYDRVDPLPKTFKRFKVIDGDTHDFRFLDAGPGKVIGLRTKGTSFTAKSKFIVD